MRRSGNEVLCEKVIRPHVNNDCKVPLYDFTNGGLQSADEAVGDASVGAPHDGYAHTLEGKAEEELVGDEGEGGEEEEGAVGGEGGGVGGEECAEDSEGGDEHTIVDEAVQRTAAVADYVHHPHQEQGQY